MNSDRASGSAFPAYATGDGMDRSGRPGRPGPSARAEPSDPTQGSPTSSATALSSSLNGNFSAALAGDPSAGDDRGRGSGGTSAHTGQGGAAEGSGTASAATDGSDLAAWQTLGAGGGIEAFSATMSTTGLTPPEPPAPPPAERTVSAQVLGQAFAPALGAQLQVFVQEGVTEARLHLNPVEMGPISVRIQIDGQSAHVEMAARDETTRQVLEQAMPALAGAMRDSGLTLTGGGVFEQSRDPQGSAGSDASALLRAAGRRSAPGEAEGTPDGARARSVRVPLGAVDVYA